MIARFREGHVGSPLRRAAVARETRRADRLRETVVAIRALGHEVEVVVIGILAREGRTVGHQIGVDELPREGVVGVLRIDHVVVDRIGHLQIDVVVARPDEFVGIDAASQGRP